MNKFIDSWTTQCFVTTRPMIGGARYSIKKPVQKWTIFNSIDGNHSMHWWMTYTSPCAWKLLAYSPSGNVLSHSVRKSSPYATPVYLLIAVTWYWYSVSGWRFSNMAATNIYGFMLKETCYITSFFWLVICLGVKRRLILGRLVNIHAHTHIYVQCVEVVCMQTL